MLLTHPERLSSCTNLEVDAAGDEYVPRTGNDFTDVPVFYFDNEHLRFGTHGFDHAGDTHGSATAFLPQ